MQGASRSLHSSAAGGCRASECSTPIHRHTHACRLWQESGKPAEGGEGLKAERCPQGSSGPSWSMHAGLGHEGGPLHVHAWSMS